jgi:c(7)-type cytochrome triheme protein
VNNRKIETWQPRRGWLVTATTTLALLLVLAPLASAEYGDVVINRIAEQEGAPPVIFPHWFHRIRFRCNVCHTELDFEMRVGANNINMDALQQGKYCGACHNNEIAWGLQNCIMCHSGKEGLKPQIKGGHQTSGPGRW